MVPRPALAGLFLGLASSMFVNSNSIAGSAFVRPGIDAPSLSASPADTGFNARVRSVTVYRGDLIAGGWYTVAGGVAANRVARWDGSAWQPMGAGIPGQVNKVAVFDTLLVTANDAITGATDPVYYWSGSEFLVLSGLLNTGWCLTEWNGNLVAGGFLEPGFVSVWDGSQWSVPGGGTDGSPGWVYAAHPYGADLVVGGYFTTAGGVSASRIARWDGSAWHALGTGVARSSNLPLVGELADYGGDLIAGGYFDTAGGAYASNIARWDGANWYALGDGVNSTVWALAVFEGKLVAGGAFTMSGADSALRVAVWDSTSWSPLGSGLDGIVWDLTVWNGYLIASGDFSNAGGKIAGWNGSEWVSISSLGGACPIATTGDLDLSGSIVTSDIIYLVNYVLKAGPDPVPCEASGDVNCDGQVVTSDIIYLVNYVLKAGATPCDACTGSPLVSGCS